MFFWGGGGSVCVILVFTGSSDVINNDFQLECFINKDQMCDLIVLLFNFLAVLFSLLPSHTERLLCVYLLEAMFDPLIPVAEHVNPFHLPLSCNFNSNFLFTAIVSNIK